MLLTWVRVFIKYCVFFSKILKYIFRTLAFLGFPSVSVYAYTVTMDFILGPPDVRSNTSAAAGLAEFRKITKSSGKNTIFNEHPVPWPQIPSFHLRAVG